MEVKIKKLVKNAVIPTYAKLGDAGMDLTAVSCTEDSDGNIVYGTGLAFEIPEGYVGLIFPRSSNAKHDLLLSNSVGVIDSGYRGEVILKFKPHWSKATMYDPNIYLGRKDEKDYKVGERVGQIMIIPYPHIDFVVSDELSKTERGDGGFGHTGLK